MSVSNTTSKIGVNAANVAGEIANSTDTLKKASGVTISIIDIVSGIMGFCPGLDGVQAGLGLLRGRLSDTKAVIGATSILGRGYEWADPSARGSITKKWQKTANRASLTAAQVLETVGFVDKLSTKFFSQPALCIGGAIPVFDLVKNALYLTSSVFGLWAASTDLSQANRVIGKAKAKIQKWGFRAMELGGLDTFNTPKVLAKYKEKLTAEQSKEASNPVKVDRYKGYVDALEKDATEENYQKRVEAFQEMRAEHFRQKYHGKVHQIGTPKEVMTKIAEAEKDLAQKVADLKDAPKAEKAQLRKEIKEHKSELQMLAKDFTKAKKYQSYLPALDKGDVKQLADYKVEHHKTKQHNGKNLKTKSWISIAAEVGKIFMITVGTLIMGLSLVFPVLTLPAVGLAMASCGLISNSFGLAKNLYRDVIYASKIKKLEPFKYEPQTA